MKPFSLAAGEQKEFRLSDTDLGCCGLKAVSQWNPCWGGERDQNFCLVSDSGESCLQVKYPKGSINPNNNTAPEGGYQCKVPFDDQYKSLSFKYLLKFEKEFDFAKGGKLPGLYGGNCPTGKQSPSEGFTTRYMWRTDGAGEIYAYVPECGGDKFVDYGLSIGRGSWSFERGKWIAIEQYVQMNTPNKKDGCLSLWIDEKPVFHSEEVLFIENNIFSIDGFYFSTFFGGSSADWASPKEQHTFFKNFQIFLQRSS